MTIYWTARKTKTSWRFEDGWDDAQKAERAAKFYRRTHRQRCVVVTVPEGGNKSTLLRELLAGRA